MQWIKKLHQWMPFGRVDEIEAEQLHSSLDQLQLIDVRTKKEFLANHIAGAIHLPITRFNRKNIEQLRLDPQRPVATICLSAHRSIPATRTLTAMGYDTRQLAGGMRTWWKAELPCVRNE